MKIDERILPRARKNHSEMLSALAEVGQSRVADLIGESESTVSRMKSGDLERFAGFLAAVGRKVVDEGQRYQSLDRIRATNLLAIQSLDTDKAPPEQCTAEEYHALKVLARIALDPEGSSRWSSL